ncbi:sigma factor [Exiguobacterium flavidum]|uniref:sigma factor n=1 Tax=Exiguobacterium flavidum TaxID=2184695 RepID=UPI000DF76F72|nr:sigma factor [Exiguobacterium flavidum]
MEHLLTKWEPLLKKMLFTLGIHPNEHDECLQAARLRLWKSIEEGKELTATFVKIRAKGGMLDHLAKRNRTLEREVASDSPPERQYLQETSFGSLMDELNKGLSKKEYDYLITLMQGKEEESGYSPSRQRSFKSELRKKVIALLS